MTAHLQATCPEVCCHPSQDLKVALQPGAVSQCDAVVPRPWWPPVDDVLSLLVLQLIPRPGGNAAIHNFQVTLRIRLTSSKMSSNYLIELTGIEEGVVLGRRAESIKG